MALSSETPPLIFAKQLPPVDLLRRLLRYEPETGKLYWLRRTPDIFRDSKHSAERECWRWNKRYADKEALTAPSGKKGHLSGTLAGESYKAHRVIWKLVYGEEPGPEIDHNDGDYTNNRIGNLKSGTKLDNQKNATRRVDNTSGVTGVHQKLNGRWIAYISVDGKRRQLGTFLNAAGAIGARKQAEIDAGFNPNHGREK